MLAVLRTKDDGSAEEVFGIVNEGGWATLPDGSSVSPATDGLSGDGYGIRKIEEADKVPEGFYPTGERKVVLEGGSPKWVDVYAEQKPYFYDLSSRQFWLAAKQAGVTKEDLIAKAYTKYSKEEAELIELEINTTIYFKRDYPLVADLASAMSLSEVELDHLWTWAASI